MFWRQIAGVVKEKFRIKLFFQYNKIEENKVENHLERK
jgi:hypothetical protein